MRSNVVVRVKPQLVRKRTQVNPQNISIVARPSRAQVVRLKDLKKIISQPKPPPPKQQQTPKKKHVNVPMAVSSKQSNKRKRIRKSQVKYISRDISPESIARIHNIRGIGKGKLLVIIGNGPSILEAQLEKLNSNPRIETLSVNKPDPRIWPTTYWSFFDSSQLRRNEELWNSFNGFIFNSTAIKKQKLTSIQFKNIGGKGWSRDLARGLHIGRSSVFASMQIAAWMNHEHVYIFGVDMNPEGINGKLHFYGRNPDVDPEARKQRFEKEAVFYDQAAQIMSTEEKLKYTFCSNYNKHRFVDYFNKLDQQTAVEAILAHATSLNKTA